MNSRNEQWFALVKNGSGFNPCSDHLVGLVVKVSTSRAADLGLFQVWPRRYFRVESTIDLNIGTPVALRPDTWS